MKKVTATQLAQNTRDVVDEVQRNPEEPVVIENYGKPQVVIVDYNYWSKRLLYDVKATYGKPKPAQEPHRHPTLEELRKYMVSTGKPVDTTKLIRQMRDED